MDVGRDVKRNHSRKRNCPSGKIRFRDENEAAKSLKRAAQHHAAQGRPTEKRWYICGLCNGGIHLTKKARKGDRAR